MKDLVALGLADPPAPIVVDFDIECRPIAWYGGDFVTKQPTAIAWSLLRPYLSNDEQPIRVAVIGESWVSAKVLDEERAMLERFRIAYNSADIVTGHYIRGFDLPVLQGACERLGIPPLGPKLTQDTKLDYIGAQGISKSQENLGAMYELEHPKVPMNTASWGRANMLLPDGIEETKKRVVGDVKQHIALRAKMLERGALGPPKRWPARETTAYTP